MSKPTELAAARMRVFMLEREKCAGCGHTLAAHMARQSSPGICHAFTSGPPCRCKAFVDEATEQMELA